MFFYYDVVRHRITFWSCLYLSSISLTFKNNHLFVQEIHEGLDFSVDCDDEEFGIFSVKFSTDGRELVAGSSDASIHVYDLQTNKVSLKIPAHTV